MSKRRRSSRIKDKNEPPLKRQKLQRTPTETLEYNDEKSPIFDKKSSSIIQDLESDSIVSSLSINSRKSLVKRLSSVIKPSGSFAEYLSKDIEIFNPIGVYDSNCLYLEDKSVKLHVKKLYIFNWVYIFSFLSKKDQINLILSCKFMFYIYKTFIGFDYLPFFGITSKYINNKTLNSFITQTSSLSDSKKKNSVYSRGTAHFSLELIRLKEYLYLSKGNKDLLDITKCAIYDYIEADARNEFSFFMNWDNPWYGNLCPSHSICQPSGLKLRLYDYQAHGLTWMLSIERIVLNKQKFIFSSLLHVPGINYVYDTNISNYDNKLSIIPYNKDMEKDLKYQESFTIQGGMYTDEMGLGKTISMIALILSNPRIQHNNSYKPAFRNSKTRIEFITKATLIICPSQLVAQWAKEITTNTSLTCCTAATAAQHRKITYKKVLETDIIIISYKFITSNPTYKALCDRRDGTGVKYGRSTDDPIELSFVQPILHAIDWHRIIIDEGHEVLLDQKIDFTKYSSNYRWYVTGTPTPNNGHTVEDVSSFLNCSLDFRKKSFSKRLLYTQVLKQSIFWRNTKQSVGDQVKIPPIDEVLKLVTLSPIEQTIYDSMCFDKNSEYRRRRFLADPTIIGNLDDIKLPNNNIKRFKTNIKSLSKQIKDTKKHLLEVIEDLKNNPKDKRLKNWKKGYEHNIIRFEEDIVTNICKSACFSRLLTENYSKDKCEGCGEYVPGLSKMSCNHNLCPLCIQKVLESEANICIKCNTTINFTKIQLPNDETITFQNDLLLESNDTWYNSLLVKYGSKFAETAKYLYNIMYNDDDVKLIVFSQYEAALLQLVSVLSNIDPDTFQNQIVMCKGNVHARKNQLARFTSKDKNSARILLLSLKNSASGTHLAVATHVLLLDPVVGTSGEARATDAQAIARAHRLGQSKPVIAVRFIILRTIDQEDYEKAYGKVVVRNCKQKSARSTIQHR